MAKRRCTVDFPERVIDLLTTMAVNLDTSKSEILRQSIALYSYVNKEVSKGNKLAIVKDNKILKDIALLNNCKDGE